jgi:hypothetical protein
MKTVFLNSIKFSIAVSLCILSNLTQAQALTPYSAVYGGQYNGMSIDVTRTLSQGSEGDYQLTSHANNFMGSIKESSQFSLDDDYYVIPKTQEMKRSIFGVKKSQRTVFNWSNQTAEYTSKKKNRTAKLEKYYLDNMGYQVQLALDLASGKKRVEYQVIRHGRVKIFKFEVTEEATLSTYLGDLNTIKVVRIREDNERQTAFWFAPSLNYLMVKFYQSEKGDDYNLTLKKVK